MVVTSFRRAARTDPAARPSEDASGAHKALFTIGQPELEEFLNLRAGAESMIYEVMQPSGKRTKFTGKTPVENTAIATAIGINLNRAARALEAGRTAESAVA